jgi:hypothetical protein
MEWVPDASAADSEISTARALDHAKLCSLSLTPADARDAGAQKRLAEPAMRLLDVGSSTLSAAA